MADSVVFNIQHYSLHDGPGIRTIIFLKGCPMRCRWCCNPESQRYEPEIFYTENKCIGKAECGFCLRFCQEGAITFPQEYSEAESAVKTSSGDVIRVSIDFNKCSQCLRCAAACPSQAITVQGKAYKVKELLDIVEKDAIFYGRGEGGLTLSGGEPLTHKELLLPLLSGAKARRINTAMETCGQADYAVLKEAAGYLDTILYDIKSMDTEKHKEYTGFDNRRILSNFEKLCLDYPDLNKKVRTPVIPGFNDTKEDIGKIRDFLEGKPGVSYELLPYHSFGKGKYKSLGKPYLMGDAVLSQEFREEMEKIS